MPIAVGDIHGCLDPLRRLVDRLPEPEELIFLGDYIDRGPDSAGVVRFLVALARSRPCRFLAGNHEDLMLGAIAEPQSTLYWIFNGGAATLESYGLTQQEFEAAGDRSAFLREHETFYAALENYVETDTHIFVHAGVEVKEPEMARQKRDVLLWTRGAFFRQSEKWQGKKIIFGHTPTVSLGLPPGQIFRAGPFTGIDTGCVYGGMLTALDACTGKIYQEPSEFQY